MDQWKYCILETNGQTLFVQIPASHAYQLTALHHRLHKEVPKLTAAGVPDLPQAIAECADLEWTTAGRQAIGSLDYINRLEREFSALEEKSYPLVSLLTEIRALQAQLEQWYEEEADNR